MQVDSRKTIVDDGVQVGDVNVVIKDVGKKLMVFGKSAQTDPRSLCWLMIKKPATAARQTSAINLDGARRVEPLTKEEVAVLKAPRTQGAGG